jgi:hypothetical protein
MIRIGLPGAIDDTHASLSDQFFDDVAPNPSVCSQRRVVIQSLRGLLHLQKARIGEMVAQQRLNLPAEIVVFPANRMEPSIPDRLLHFQRLLKQGLHAFPAFGVHHHDDGPP